MPTSARPNPRPLFSPDPGWLFLVPGLTILIGTAILPAIDDLAEARFRRDEARALRQYQADRLDNHRAARDALIDDSPDLSIELVSMHLNQIPDDKVLFLADLHPPDGTALSPFRELDPSLHPVQPPAQPDSLFHRLATDRSTRLWLLGAGAICTLIGLFPPAPLRGTPEPSSL